MKTQDSRKQNPGLTTGTREAVEAAIGLSKGNRASTWEKAIKGAHGKIPQWEDVVDDRPKKRATG